MPIKQLDIRWSWAQASEIMRDHDGAVYLVDLQQFELNCRELLGSLQRIYPKSRLGYSYKTNYTPAICRRANELGCYAEVVSRMELDLAFRLGIPGARVIFNGPLKSIQDLQLAADRGVLVNIDNVDELSAIEGLDRSSRPPLRVAIRCNFALGKDHCSRFGFDSNSDLLHGVVDRIRAIRNCRLVGLHCHFSHYREVESYRRRAETMVELARLFSDQDLELLDLGGGFCGKMPDELKAQFKNAVPNFEDYARAIGPIVSDAFGPDGPELVLEPGMGLVADCMKFMTTVTSTKIIRGKQFAGTAGSVYNLKPTMNAMNLPLEVLRRDSAVAESDLPNTTDIVGFTCMEVDVLYRDLRESLRVGDIVIFGNVGAYTTTMLPPFIRPAPAMLAIDNGAVSLVRRAQTLDDILAGYVV